MNSSFIISEIFSSSFHPPKHNWTDGTIIGISYSPMNILLGQNASIKQHVVKRGNKPSFENIVYSKKISDFIPEIQIINLISNARCSGFFYLKSESNQHNLTIDFHESAKDLEIKLKSLPDLGSIQVTKSSQDFSNSWTITFSSNQGDVKMLDIFGTYSTNNVTMSLEIFEARRGIPHEQNFTAMDLSPGTTHIARIAARNRVGLSAYIDSLQSNGLRIQPMSIVTRAIPAIVSFSVLTISQSQLGIFYSVPKSKGKDIDNLNVERTSSANIRIRREIELGINCNELNDVSRSFRFFFHGQSIDYLEASDFLQVH